MHNKGGEEMSQKICNKMERVICIKICLIAITLKIMWCKLIIISFKKKSVFYSYYECVFVKFIIMVPFQKVV